MTLALSRFDYDHISTILAEFRMKDEPEEIDASDPPADAAPIDTIPQKPIEQFISELIEELDAAFEETDLHYSLPEDPEQALLLASEFALIKALPNTASTAPPSKSSASA
jgi:hypothetical protein